MTLNHTFILVTFAALILTGCGTSTPDTTSHEQQESSMPNIDLADSIFKRILAKHGDSVDPSQIPKPQQTVMLVYHSHGILGNGGFQYLFEGDFPGDPEFLLTREAYKTIGAEDASAAFQKAFAVFPNSTPPADIDTRLQLWQSKYNLRDSLTDDSSPDSMYFNAMDGVMQKLNDYVNANRSEFAALPE